ncbi:DUF1080 domain-containing protein [Maribacter sp. MJ134]|uniref:3-keto-disaccharide hydrolase n=1 Tax=Maribacter sp. MJ134 TaxID=2496865 RepID=UPI000F81DCD8|nr:DUF1080 domain-containing protein [Maribacter sp. MJ134]AZQ59534.1 DUF1080 domain-containing protein [Maribacter sp. MJ134]
MKQLLVVTALVFAFGSCKEKTKPTDIAEQKVELEEKKETQADWTTLFDGSSFDNWHYYGRGEVTEPWKLEDGAMVFYPPQVRKKGEAFNIVTKQEYTDFVLSLEWRIAEAGNSGIFWGVHEDPSLSEAYQSGPEIQVLDNDKHPDGKNGTTHQAGALYDMVAPSEDVTKPIGEWNHCVITVNHKTNTGIVVLNDVEIVNFPVNDPEWSAMVSQSKFNGWEHFGKYTIGKIGLQDHGDVVAYRNIKIKEL